jgi:tetratricopeptide (TPR) repeat protein
LRLLLRKSRNFLTTASASLNEVMSMLIGRMREPLGAYMSEASENSLKRFSGDIISYVGASQDPLLERFIGKRVVVELLEGDEVHEHVGLFKNYSSQFLELLDVQFPCKQTLTLEQDAVVNTAQIMAVAREEEITFANQGETPILVHSLRTEEGEEQLLNVVVDGGEQISIHPDTGFEKADLQLKVVRELDMILPRSRAMVRHRAGNLPTTTLTDIVFDLGLVLRKDKTRELMEQRLRERLQHDPQNAPAAANLGALLIQEGKYAEAETWLAVALDYRQSLPDRGRRAEMEYRELQRKRSAASVVLPVQH